MKGSRFLAPVFALALAFSTFGAVNAQECGRYEWHGETELTKGRTDGIIYHLSCRPHSRVLPSYLVQPLASRHW